MRESCSRLVHSNHLAPHSLLLLTSHSTVPAYQQLVQELWLLLPVPAAPCSPSLSPMLNSTSLVLIIFSQSWYKLLCSRMSMSSRLHKVYLLFPGWLISSLAPSIEELCLDCPIRINKAFSMYYLEWVLCFWCFSLFKNYACIFKHKLMEACQREHPNCASHRFFPTKLSEWQQELVAWGYALQHWLPLCLVFLIEQAVQSHNHHFQYFPANVSLTLCEHHGACLP